ncbi:MAG: endonuclease domain-containing protein [Candidatus Binatia bacterium]
MPHSTLEKRREYLQRKYHEDPEKARAYNRARHAANPRWQFSATLKQKYGITADDYDRLFAAQKGVCRLCGGLLTVGKRLNIDHDHKTGRICGLVHSQCNTALGVVDRVSVARVAEYLRVNQQA